ncbi:MAG TPA: hypothetical protein DDZ51_12340 [Planctomycetaceae bacterium]|nr:hypothetical protein [Planctomycetaceae bacterium]
MARRRLKVESLGENGRRGDAGGGRIRAANRIMHARVGKAEGSQGKEKWGRFSRIGAVFG